MKIIKRTLLIIGIFFVLLIGAAIILPIIYEDEIVALVKEQANENLNAEVDFGDYDLSLISTFPYFGLSIQDLEVKNKEPFEGTTLADIGEFEVMVDVMAAIGGEYKIKKVMLHEPRVHVVVLPDGRANWDIALPSEDTAAVEEEEPEAEEGAPLEIALQEYGIEDGHIIYDDASLSFFTELKGFDHTGNGDFTMKDFTLSTETAMESMDLNYDGVRYVDRADVELDADLGMDLEAFKFTFQENELRMNELVLGFDGYFAMPEEGFDMDIDYKTEKTAFRTLLSMVPAVYSESFADIESSGEIGLKGHVKGMYSDDKMPGFGLDLSVRDGSFSYPDLPESAENIQMDLNIERDEGPDLDNLTIDLSTFHVELAENPFDMCFHLAYPISDPEIDADLKAQLDLGSLRDVVPMEDQEYVGNITADLELKGRMSTIESENYEDFHAEGKMILMDMIYKSESLPYDVAVKKTHFNFSPEYLELVNFESTLGQSDLSAEGRIDNYIAYALKDETLEGRFGIESERFDLNELMASPEGEDGTDEEPEEAEESGESADEEMGVIEVPENVDISLDASMGKVLYGDIDMDDVQGNISVADRVASLNDVGLKVFDGTVTLNGTYGTTDPTRPKVDFDYDIKNLDIEKTASKVNTVEKLAPIAKNTRGRFSSRMELQTALKQNMDPDYDSMEGEGKVEARDIYIEGFEPLNELAGKLGIDRLAKQNIDDVNLSFEIRDGKVHVDPYTVRSEGLKATIHGHTTFEQEMDYNMDMEVPRDKLGGEANQMMESLVSKANQKGTNMSLGETVPVGVKMTGEVQDPKVSLTMKGMEKDDIKDQVKDKVKEEVDKAKDKAADEAIKEAKKRGDQMVKEAEKKADRIKKEAREQRDQIISEAEKRGQKQVEKASNPIAKQAAKETKKKIIKEAEKEGDKKVKQADERADKVVDEAKKKRQQLIDEAKEKAGKDD